MEDGTFVSMIRSSEDKALPLLVYNARSSTVREIVMVPTKSWPGEGLIGITIRHSSFAEAFKVAFRIVSVFPNGPAADCGLQSHTDYIVGALSALFTEEAELERAVASFQRRPLELLVYSSSTGALRETAIIPDAGWGGKGSIGAELGRGVLHSLPFTQDPARAPLADLVPLMGRRLTQEEKDAMTRPAQPQQPRPQPKSLQPQPAVVGVATAEQLVAVPPSPTEQQQHHGHSHSHGEACSGHGHDHAAVAPAPAPAPAYPASNPIQPSAQSLAQLLGNPKGIPFGLPESSSHGSHGSHGHSHDHDHAGHSHSHDHDGV